MYAPTHLFYLTSLRCNERCTKCSHWRVREHPPMVETALLVEAVREVRSAVELCIVGGEPLLYRQRVVDIVSGIADLPLRTTLVTNGLLCTPDFVLKLRERNMHFVFSIDTVDPERWRCVRGTDSIDRVFANLQFIQETLRPEQLSVQSVLARETVQDVESVGRWCRERGIYHSIQPYVQRGFDGSWSPVELSTPEARPPATESEHLACLAADRNLSIMPDGSVFTCFQQDLIPEGTRPLGRLGETSIGEMLRASYAQEVLQRMRRCSLPCKVLKCNQ